MGARPREAGEDQPGQHRQKAHAGEDFRGNDDMGVIGLRIHVAVTDGRQRLDREVEQPERLVAGDIGDRRVAEPIQKRKGDVDQHEERRRAAEEYRPVHRQTAMIEIGPEAFGEPSRFHLACADPYDRARPGCGGVF